MDAMIKLHPLAYIGLLLFVSYAGGQVANVLKMPHVVGYLVMGRRGRTTAFSLGKGITC